MIKSMTGFGRGEYSEEGLRITVEIKSVNHRYNDISVRMPRSLNVFEDRIRKQVGARLPRGKTEVFISWQDSRAAGKAVAINKELAVKYYVALKELAAEVTADFNVGVHQLAMYPEVMQAETGSLDEEAFWQKLQAALKQTLDKIETMRYQEGEYIAADISARLGTLEGYIEKLDERAPQIVAEYRERLFVKLQETLGTAGIAVDETRVLQETAIFAERTNFTEELVRLRSHVKQFGKTLAAAGAIGKKLDFLVQEINRETNTAGSKCNDYDSAALVVEMKAEIEKIREQIQNIE